MMKLKKKRNKKSSIKNLNRKNPDQRFLRVKSNIDMNPVWSVSLFRNLPLASIWKVKVVQSKKQTNNKAMKKS